MLSVGELCPDFVISGLRCPAPVLGTEQEFESSALVLGSATAIATVLMSRLGLKTALVSRVGDDEHGRFCLAQLAEAGVDACHVKIDRSVRTGLTVSLAYPSDRLLLTVPGTMAVMPCEDVPADLILSARHLHVSSFFLQPRLQPGLPELFAQARHLGLTTSLDTGFDPAGRWMSDELRALLPHVDILLPNEVELRALGGTADPVSSARRLLDLGVGRVAAKLGAAGGIVVRPAGRASCGSPGVTVVDTTGAGDAFNAGLLYGHLSGYNDDASLRLATACGAMTAAAVGGTGGFRSRDQVEAFLAWSG